MKRTGKTIIYSDLDGTLLDEKSYSFLEAAPALRAAQAKGIPVIFCSSKTSAEIARIRQRLEVRDPFIVENGGAIYSPTGYFPFTVDDSVSREGYDVIELGEPYNRLIDLFRLLRSGPPAFGVIGFSDLTVKELAMECCMTLDEAARAKARDYSEPFRFNDITPAKMDVFLERIRQSGRQFAVGGRYYHLQGSYDKGRAVDILNHMFERVHGHINTIGIGDSPNDAPMLSKVDKPVIVKRPSGVHQSELVSKYPKALLTEGVGPKGWAEAVLQIVSAEN